MAKLIILLGLILTSLVLNDEVYEETGIEEIPEEDKPVSAISLKGLRPENPNFYFGKFRLSTSVNYKSESSSQPMTGRESASLAFVRLSKVGKIVIQTLNDEGHMIRHFKMQASIDGHSWIDIHQGKPLRGNTEAQNSQQICFIHKFFARKIKFIPVEFLHSPSFKVDIYLDMKDNVNLEGSRPEFFSQVKNLQTGKMSGFCDQVAWITLYEKYGGPLLSQMVTDTLFDDFVLNDEELKSVFVGSKNQSDLKQKLNQYIAQLAGGPRSVSCWDMIESLKENQDCFSKLRTYFKIALRFNNIEGDDVSELVDLFGTDSNALPFDFHK